MCRIHGYLKDEETYIITEIFVIFFNNSANIMLNQQIISLVGRSFQFSKLVGNIKSI